MRDRVLTGLAREPSEEPESRTRERIEALAANSRVMGALSLILTAPALAAREARVRRLLDPLLGLDLPARLRIGAFVSLVAVATHTILLALLGVPVHALGWGVRAGLFVAGAIVLRRPGVLAAAWIARTE